MEALSKWLMKTNARLVFICTVIALIGASAYWFWQISRPLDMSVDFPVKANKDPLTSLGLLGFVNRQLSPESYALPGNSFLTPGTPERLYNRAPVTPPATNIIVKADPPPKPKPKPEPKPKPKPKVPPVQVTYRGIFKKTDGTKTALIEDSRTARKSFYEVGENISGATVEDIGDSSLQLKMPGGKVVELSFGEAVSISE